jgi:hypothetical protein
VTTEEIERMLKDAESELIESKPKNIHCIRFAPNCPEQNPIDDIWLQAILRVYLDLNFWDFY